MAEVPLSSLSSSGRVNVSKLLSEVLRGRVPVGCSLFKVTREVLHFVILNIPFHGLDFVKDLLWDHFLRVDLFDHAESLIVISFGHVKDDRVLWEESLKRNHCDDLADVLDSKWNFPERGLFLGLHVVFCWQNHANEHLSQNSDEKEDHVDSTGPRD